MGKLIIHGQGIGHLVKSKMKFSYISILLLMVFGTIVQMGCNCGLYNQRNKFDKENRVTFTSLMLTYKYQNSNIILNIEYQRNNLSNNIRTFKAKLADSTNAHIGHFSKEDTTKDLYRFYYIRTGGSVSLSLQDSSIKMVIHPYGRKTILPGGINLFLKEGDTTFHAERGPLILEEKGIWKEKEHFYIFKQGIGNNRRDSSRFMYVHNIGFIWEEFYIKNRVHRWELIEVDGIPLMQFISENSDFSFWGTANNN